MKKKENIKNNTVVKKRQGIQMSGGLITAALIALFLSGKIIEIPHRGTHEGGVYAAIGVCIIVISMFIVVSISRQIKQTKKA